MNQITWTHIQSRIEALAETYAPARLAVDATRDNKIVSNLEQSGLYVDPVNFSNKKEVLIDNLAIRLEAGELTLSADAPVLVNELEVYE